MPAAWQHLEQFRFCFFGGSIYFESKMAYFSHNKITEVWGQTDPVSLFLCGAFRGQGKNVSTREHNHDSTDFYLKIE